MEPKKLSLEEMEEIEGGNASCVFAAISLATAVGGLFFSAAHFNPIGIGWSLVGIYAGGPGMISACGLY